MKKKTTTPKKRPNKKEPWLDEQNTTPKTTGEKKKKALTVEETKLGVTMVLSKEDITSMGLSTKLMTGEVIREVRDRLGLFPRKRDQQRGGA